MTIELKLQGGKQQMCFFLSFLGYERSKIREQLTLGPHFDDSATELELSEESESSVVQPNTMTLKTGVKNQG